MISNFTKRKYNFEEYFVNSNHFRKLYGVYIEKSIYNKVLDKLVFISMVTIAMSVVMPFIIEVPKIVLIVINTITTLVILVFILELLRSYAHSKSSMEFLRNHWIDFILISFLSFYFLFISILGFLVNLSIVNEIKLFVTDSKHLRVFYKLFRR